MGGELKKVICLTPVYNDWISFNILVKKIEEEFKPIRNLYSASVTAIDDGSSDQFDADSSAKAIPLEIITLNKNVGHQRAIAIGLQYINAEKKDFDFVVVLDSDGEDNPAGIIKLLSKCEEEGNRKVIFAQRKKRQEPLLFKSGYLLYKSIFYLFTGEKISFGNFSCIPKRTLKRVAMLENLWNHYSGSIIHSKTPFEKVLLDRDKRYSGKSKMNSTSLVLHGLSSISVYFDFLSARILKLSLFGMIFCFLSVVTVLFLRFFTHLAVPGWASNLILIFLVIILQLSSVTLIILLMHLSSRKNINSLPADVYKGFIEAIHITNK